MPNGHEVEIGQEVVIITHLIDVPQDFSEIKQKFILGLTKRQCVFFGLGAAIGIGAYFAAKNYIDPDIATYLIFICGAPFFFFAFKPKATNMYPEERIKMMVDYHKSEKLKIYQTESTFEKIDRQIAYNRLKQKLKKAGVNIDGGDNIGIGEKVVKLLKKLD